MIAAIPLTQRIVALGLLAAVATFVAAFPIGRLWLAAGFTAYALLLLRAPRAWLVVVPAAMPVLDLAFFSGWFFFDEFDALVLLTVAVLMWRQPIAREDFRIGRPLAIAVALLASSYLASAAVVLTPWPAVDGNSFASYYSPFNALRVAKGFAWPLLLLPFLNRAVRDASGSDRLLLAGLVLGLSGMSLIALYEHWLFVGLFNFGHEYRISGPFSSMHTGSGHIDLWLATTMPLIAVAFFERWSIPVRMVAFGVAGLSFYILLATASRTPFVATAAALVVILVSFIVIRIRHRKAANVALPLLMVAALCGAFVLPFVHSTRIGERFASVERDIGTRIAHYREALRIRDTGLGTRLFGMGLGRFPRIFDERRPDAPRMARHSFDGEFGSYHLTLQSGNNIYFGQKVAVEPHAEYLFSFSYRTRDQNVVLKAAICEKWLLHSSRCTSNAFELPATGGRWKSFSKVVETEKVGSPAGHIGRPSIRPVRLDLFASGARLGVSLDDVALITADGRNLIRNGNFDDGNDHWFWTEDYHLPWHTENMVVNVLFDQGWLGLVAVTILTALAFVALCRRVLAGRSDAVPWLAALVGYLVTALVVSPFDQPRLAMLFYLLCFIAVLRFARAGGAAGGS